MFYRRHNFIALNKVYPLLVGARGLYGEIKHRADS